MKKYRISIRIKTLILCVATFLLTSFILTVIVALLVNHWKKQLVKNSITLAEEHGKELAQELTRIIEQDLDLRVEKLKENPKALSSIQLFLKQNENIIMAAFVDERGTILLEHYQGEETSGTAVLSPGSKYTASVPSPYTHPDLQIILKNPPDEIHEKKVPIMKGENLLGQLEFRVSENAILSRIAYSSVLITRTLFILLAALFILLVISYFFLWRLFSHHLALVQERDRLDKLASIGTLASGLAHEIRNPLNAMNVNLDVIGEEIDDPREDSAEKAREILSNLKKEIAQLNSTLSNFMKFALPGKTEKLEVDFTEIVKETLEFFRAEFERSNISMRMNLLEKCVIAADPTSLKQLIMNLVLNAVQAMEKSAIKRLEITLHPEGKFWHLTVKDTGTGFGDVNPEKCFEVFYTTKEGGSGFGLPIARQVAFAHNGRLWAENTESGNGARFHLLLPMLHAS